MNAASDSKHSATLPQLLRRRILAGLVLIVPIAITLFVARLILDFIYNLLEPIMDQFYKLPIWQDLLGHRLEPIPGINLFLALLLAAILLYLIGLVSTSIIVNRAYRIGEELIMRIPLVKSVYSLSKQVIELMTDVRRRGFKEVLMIEYPRRGVYSLAFLTAETHLSRDERRHVTLFLPTTPNPTSGFMLILPAEEVWRVDLSVESGIKVIMSGGLVSPETMTVWPYLEAPPEAVVDNPSEAGKVAEPPDAHTSDPAMVRAASAVSPEAIPEALDLKRKMFNPQKHPPAQSPSKRA